MTRARTASRPWQRSPDQPALHGLLAKVRDPGLCLIPVRRPGRAGRGPERDAAHRRRPEPGAERHGQTRPASRGCPKPGDTDGTDRSVVRGGRTDTGTTTTTRRPATAGAPATSPGSPPATNPGGRPAPRPLIIALTLRPHPAAPSRPGHRRERRGERQGHRAGRGPRPQAGLVMAARLQAPPADARPVTATAPACRAASPSTGTGRLMPAPMIVMAPVRPGGDSPAVLTRGRTG